MKKRRISSVTDSNSKRTRKKQAVSHIETHEYSGPSFSDLPRDILLNILLRMSTKMVFVCKFVCKTWYDLVSDPEIGKVLSQVYPLIRSWASWVHLVQQTFSDNPGFEIKERYRLLKHQSGYKVVTCNGLLCLFEPFYGKKYLPIFCNPVTGEYINFPQSKKINFRPYNICYGFGFSPATNQYKVLRMSWQGVAQTANTAEVHILGTKTWKNIGFFSQSIPKVSPTYLDGFLYWSSKLDNSNPLSIFTFDVEKELFGSVSAPARDPGFLYEYVSLGVLGGELCISGSRKSGAIQVWTMKNDGIDHEKAWSKVFSFDHLNSNPKQYFGPFQPIKYLNDGALLMFYSFRGALVYVDPKVNRFRYFRVRQFNKTVSKVKVIAYTPSFVSLKHVLSGDNVEVLNFKSRCSKSKLDKEAYGIDIVEEELHSAHDYGFDQVRFGFGR